MACYTCSQIPSCNSDPKINRDPKSSPKPNPSPNLNPKSNPDFNPNPLSIRVRQGARPAGGSVHGDLEYCSAGMDASGSG